LVYIQNVGGSNPSRPTKLKTVDKFNKDSIIYTYTKETTMNITLRKANAIQTSVNEIVKGLSFETSVSINEFQIPTTVISQTEEVFATNLARRDALLLAMFEIRKLVAKGNDVAGINDMLADVAHLEKQIQFFNGLATKTPKEDMSVIKGKLDKIRNAKEESRMYGARDEVTVSVLEKEDIAGFKQVVAQSKRAKQQLQDQLLEMNVRTEIPLSEQTVKTLTDEGII
jgi:hypothetical protein